MVSNFNKKAIPKVNVNHSDNLARISRTPPSIPPKPSTNVLAKFKYHKSTKSFAQATKGTAEDILRIKKAFPKLLPKNIVEIHNITVTLLENFLWNCSMGYTLYPWISLLEPTLETSYKPQT